MNNYQWLLKMDGADRKAWFDAEHVETEERALDGDTAALNAKLREVEAERDELKRAIIADMLTDDEPHEGDVCAILRKAAKCTSVNTSVGDVLRYNVPGNEPSAWQTAEEAVEALADIVERDYVRRDSLTGLVGRMADTAFEPLISDSLRKQVDELTAERDKLQEQLRIGWECECRLQAERELYREKFGKCIDYADAIHALMDDEGMA